MLQWQGMHVGIMGLVERDWLATLATINEEVLMLLCSGVLPPPRVLCLLCAVLYMAYLACHCRCRGGHVFDICSASGAAACSRLVYVVPDLASASYKSVQDVTYLDFIDEGRRLAQFVGAEGGDELLEPLPLLGLDRLPVGVAAVLGLGGDQQRVIELFRRHQLLKGHGFAVKNEFE